MTGFQGSASFMVSPSLKRISAGWVDQELLTIRKMAASGATADDIGLIIGWTKARVINYIRRNNLVWNRIRGDKNRHIISSAASIGSHMKMGHLGWLERGRAMRSAGASIDEISAETETPVSTIVKYFYRHGDPKPKGQGRKRPANRAKMLALIMRLHSEAVLSEEQVVEATGLSRPQIRVLATTPSKPEAA